jgi:hypothetical protein
VVRLPAIKINKPILFQLLADPSNIIGEVWFGRLLNLTPFVSLRLPKDLCKIAKEAGEITTLVETSPYSRTIDETYAVGIDSFLQLIKKDGFGTIVLNNSKNEQEVFVSIEVQSVELREEFKKAKIPMETNPTSI